MRSWCYRHPTVTLVCLVAWYAAWCFITGHFLFKGGWWILAGLACLVVTAPAREQIPKWWRRT